MFLVNPESDILSLLGLEFHYGLLITSRLTLLKFHQELMIKGMPQTIQVHKHYISEYYRVFASTFASVLSMLHCLFISLYISFFSEIFTCTSANFLPL